MDRLAKEGDLFRCFFGPPHSPSTELLTKLKWYDGTTAPYYYSSRKPREEEEQSQIQTKIQVKSKNDIMQYCNTVIENVVKNSGNKPVCCIDFLINYVGRDSLKQALTLEKAYDDNRIAGLMYCTYKTDNLVLIKLFVGA